MSSLYSQRKVAGSAVFVAFMCKGSFSVHQPYQVLRNPPAMLPCEIKKPGNCWRHLSGIPPGAGKTCSTGWKNLLNRCRNKRIRVQSRRTKLPAELKPISGSLKRQFLFQHH